MPEATFHFVPGFLWGTATAAHQVEGGNNNNTWSKWEEEPGRIVQGQRAGRACDWWSGRWKEDLNRAADTGQNTHRLSLEWSRVEPVPGIWDETAIDAYREIVRGLVERKMIPMVTLHHFTDPIWLAERGGWENAETPLLFGRFVEKMAEALKEFVTMWVPINEPNVYVYNAYIEGIFPPGKKDMGAAFKVMANLIRGHAAAYRAIHRIQPQAQVGTAIHYRGSLPARSWMPLDGMVANLQSHEFNDSFQQAVAGGKLNFLLRAQTIPEARNTADFLGLNYYSTDLVKFVLSPARLFGKRSYPPGAQLSPGGFLANMPDGMTSGLRWAGRFKLPIYITENGVEDAEDRLRPDYLVQHLHNVWRHSNFSIPVRGYYHWSLVDNFEWERGWTQRFGLWGLNTETQVRQRRPSVDLYATICKTNSITSALVNKYAPASFDRLFPV